MLIIKKGDNGSVDKMLKTYKRKVREIRLHKEIKSRREFLKPSEVRRKKIQAAVYQQKNKH
jgi:small subunit ribosomal protein S21